MPAEADLRFKEKRLPTHASRVWQSIQPRRPSVTCLWTAMQDAIPAIQWVSTYKRQYLQKDIAAGFTVGVLLVPQGMAYALLAGLPPFYGLYACLGPALMYAIFGTSRHMHIGPFALVSLLVGNGVAGVVQTDSLEEYVDTTVTMSMIVGLMMTLMALLRLGFISSLLTDPVLTGFTTAAALLIATSQVGHALGINAPRASFLETWAYLFTNIQQTNFLALGMTVVAVVMLLLLKWLSGKWQKRLPVPLPGELIVLVIFMLTVHFARLGRESPDDPKWKIAVLGEVPAGLPPLRFPRFSNFTALLLPSFVVTMVDYLICIAISKTFAAKGGYDVNPNQELVAVGLANILGSMWCAYPAAGSLSRSAVVFGIGAETALHNVVAVGVVVIVLLVATPALRPLPMCVLAAIIFVALKSLLLQFSEPLRLWKISKLECFVWIATFFTTLFLGTEAGLSTGIGLSMLNLMQKTARPRIVALGRLPGTTIYRDLMRFADAEEIPGVLILRFDNSLHFVNRDVFKDQLTTHLKRRKALPLALSLRTNRQRKSVVQPLPAVERDGEVSENTCKRRNQLHRQAEEDEEDESASSHRHLRGDEADELAGSPLVHRDDDTVEESSARIEVGEVSVVEKQNNTNKNNISNDKDQNIPASENTDLNQRDRGKPAIHFTVVLVCAGVNHIDTSATSCLIKIINDLRGKGIRVIFACMKGVVRDFLKLTTFWQELESQEGGVFVALHAAVRAASNVHGLFVSEYDSGAEDHDPEDEDDDKQDPQHAAMQHAAEQPLCAQGTKGRVAADGEKEDEEERGMLPGVVRDGEVEQSGMQGGAVRLHVMHEPTLSGVS